MNTANVSYLISFLFQHTVVGIVRNGEYVRRQYRSHPLILIQSYILWIVDWIEFEWIQCDEYAANVCVYVAGNKALPQILQQCGLI